MSLNEGRREVIVGDRSGDGVVTFLTLHLAKYLEVNVAAIAELEGRVGGGGGGDKFSVVYGDELLAHGNQVTVGANVHALMRDGRSGVAAFIKIIYGKDFEFSVSAHHDGFAV